MKKNVPFPSQFVERIEHHATPGSGVRAPRHLHHHHAADDEQPGDDAALRQPPPKTDKKPKINHIVVDAKGQTYLNDAPVTIPALRAELQQLKAEDPGLAWW